MTTQRQELTTQAFNFNPTTLQEAQEYATIFANSGLCPETYKGRPNDILVIWKMGQELGLDKMQSLRTLGCVNGVPFAYGDGLLALVKRHPDFEDMHEWFEGSIETNDLIAYCKMKRRGQQEVTQSFSMQDAKNAGLWDKKGVWQQYKRRMLQHRARGFCAKDTFPDALFGLMSKEEADSVAQQRAPQVVKPVSKGVKGVEEALGIDENVIEAELITMSEDEPNEAEKAEEFVPDNDYIPEKDDPIINNFLATVEKFKVSDSLKKRWCAQFGVNVIDSLPIDAMQKIINHYHSKESK